MEKVCFIFIAVVIWFSLINVCVVGSCGGFVFDFIFFNDDVVLLAWKS